MRHHTLRHTLRLALLALPFLLAGCATGLPDRSDSYPVPIGRLGHRIGTYLRIEGVRAEAGKVGDSTLSVDSVNGVACDPPREIWLDNLSLPSGVRCQLSGFESGRWIGIPPDVSAADGVPQHQALWQFHVYFVVTAVQGPASLKASAQQIGR